MPPTSVLLFVFDPGVKLGLFDVGAEECDPDKQQRQQRPEDVQPLLTALRGHMPFAAGDLLQFSTCMFTMTPDHHFVIDHHPRYKQVGVALLNTVDVYDVVLCYAVMLVALPLLRCWHW